MRQFVPSPFVVFLEGEDVTKWKLHLRDKSSPKLLLAEWRYGSGSSSRNTCYKTRRRRFTCFVHSADKIIYIHSTFHVCLSVSLHRDTDKVVAVVDVVIVRKYLIVVAAAAS